jgi:hypothetical protein
MLGAVQFRRSQPMRTSLILAFLAFAFLANTTAANTFSIDPVAIEVPAGFEGPISRSEDAAAVVAFIKPHPDSRMSTLLQITIYDFGDKLRGLPAPERGTAAERYLLQFLSGVERRRSNFTPSEPNPVVLGGIPAAKVTWRGLANGIEAVGVMYCVVSGTKVISFHTQDIGSAPTPAMQQAMHAIEQVKMRVPASPN